MIEDLFNSSDDENTIFRDVIFLALISFVAMLMIVIPFLADQTEKETKEILSPGNVIVEIFWDNNLTDDIDLWVIGPGEPGPIGFSNKSGTIWNLLRDDLGYSSDLSGLNYENSYSRGLKAGWYRFNVHWYTSKSNIDEIKINMVVSIKKTPTATTKQIMSREVILTLAAKETTVFYFYLDDDFNVDRSTISFGFECLKCGS